MLARCSPITRQFGDCVGIGVVISGMVDLGGGRLTTRRRSAGATSTRRAAGGRDRSCRSTLENSVKACILAQVWAVTGDAPVDGPVAFVNVSDGVGVGIAIDGKLLRGANNIAGEFGHVPLNVDGPVCSCGQTRLLGSVRVEPRHHRALSGHRSVLAGHGQAAAPTVSRHHRPRPGRRRAARSRRCGDGYYLGRGFATIVKSDRPDAASTSAARSPTAWDLVIARRCARRCASKRSLQRRPTPRSAWCRSPSIRACAARPALVMTPAFAAPIVA